MTAGSSGRMVVSSPRITSTYRTRTLCPVCGREVAVRLGGRMTRHHMPGASRNSLPCVGSFQEAVEVYTIQTPEKTKSDPLKPFHPYQYGTLGRKRNAS